MGNTFQKLLRENRAEFLEKWEDAILSSYAPDTFHIFKKQKDQFANPIGHKVRTGLAELYDLLCEASERQVLAPDLEELIKLRAVQKISASEAVAFVFQLKELIRQELSKKEIIDFYKEWVAFDARVDAAALAIFDMFMVSKEQLYQVRLNEFRQGRYMLTDGSICPSALVRRNGQGAEAQTGIIPFPERKTG